MKAIQTSIDDNIATITFDQPASRANVLSTEVWTELGQSIDSLAHQPDVRGAILVSAKPGIFIAGADLKELTQASNDPGLARSLIDLGLSVLHSLESLPFPTVAVLNGATLGGGLEVALACDFRVTGDHEKLRIGFPEIGLGLIPGWGGTQRLPRLVGVEEAINRLLSGEPYDETDPPPDDLIDESTSSGDLMNVARKWIAQGDWKEVRQLKNATVLADLLPSKEFLGDVRETLEAIEAPLQQAAAEVLKVVLQGSMSELPAAIRIESEAFLRLLASEVARQRIADFFARRSK